MPISSMHRRAPNNIHREVETEEEGVKLDALIAQRQKMRENIKRRKEEIRNSLGNINLIIKSPSNSSGMFLIKSF